MTRPQTNNNPFDLKDKTPSAWKGLIGMDNDGLLKFDSAANGVRAGFINLINAYLKQGYDTIEKIFPRYAPSSDGNVPEAYIKAVITMTGIPRNQKISTKDQILKIGQAIVKVEDGTFWVKAEDFENGFTEAIKSTKFVTAASVAGLSLTLIVGAFIIYILTKQI